MRFVEEQTCVRRVRSSLYRWPLGEWFCKPWCVHRVCCSFRNHSESGSSGLARVAEARVGFVLPMLWGEAEAKGPKPLLGLCDPCGLSLTARPREGPRVLVWVNDVVLVNETRPGVRGRFASRHNTVRDGRRGGLRSQAASGVVSGGGHCLSKMRVLGWANETRPGARGDDVVRDGRGRSFGS